MAPAPAHRPEIDEAQPRLRADLQLGRRRDARRRARRGHLASAEHYGNVLVDDARRDGVEGPAPALASGLPADAAAGPVTVVKLWALFDDVEPGGGGTPELARLGTMCWRGDLA